MKPSLILGLGLVLCLGVACKRDPYVPDVYTGATAEPGGNPDPGDAGGSPDDRGADLEDEMEAPDGVPTHPAPIALDGRFDEWESIPVLYEDPVGDPGETGIDIGVIKAAHDDQFFYLYVEVGTSISLANDQYLTLYLDTDLNTTTGQQVQGLGAEIQWVFGQKGGQVRGRTIAPVGFADIRFRALPSVTSDRFEMAIGRHEQIGGQALFRTDSLALALVDHTWNGEGAEDGDTAPAPGEAIRYSLAGKSPAPPEPQSLARTPGTRLRIVSWNSLYTGLLDEGRAPSFRRILKALDPDIICLQEAWYGNDTAAVLDEWLPLPDGAAWQVASWDNEVTLSRYPLVPGWPGNNGLLPDNVLATGIEVAPGERIIIFNAHLAWGDQDELRQQQADGFIAYLREMQGDEEAIPQETPFLFTGDLNLVGDAQQLATLLTGDIQDEETYGADHAPDWDGSDLANPLLLQTERRMGWTWRSDGGYYWPGLMDYALYSDSALTLLRGFLLYTPAMSQENLGSYGLYDIDSPTASDHLPLVLDFDWE